MRLKNDTVITNGVKPELLLGLYVADEVYREYGVSMVVTELCNTDGHSNQSLHYAGCAADIRVSNLPSYTNVEEVARKIKQRLNIDYDVLPEGDHIHLEWQPKCR